MVPLSIERITALVDPSLPTTKRIRSVVDQTGGSGGPIWGRGIRMPVLLS